MRYHRLDLNLLVVLDALLSNRSVGKTAQLLNLTQPAISNALAKLRTHFNDELLVPIGRSMVPTAFAEQLAEQIRAAMDDLGKIATTTSRFDASTSERIFTLVCSDYVFAVFIASAMRELISSAPGVQIRCLLTTEWTQTLLLQGKADLLVAPNPRLLPDHPTTSLFEDSYACIAWTGNCSIGDTLTLEEYFELGHVSASLGINNRPPLEQETLARTGIARRVVASAPTFSTVPELLIGTNLIATVHKRAAINFVKRFPVRIVDVPAPIDSITVGLQWHVNRTNDSGVAWLRDFLLQHATTLEPLNS